MSYLLSPQRHTFRYNCLSAAAACTPRSIHDNYVNSHLSETLQLPVLALNALPLPSQAHIRVSAAIYSLPTPASGLFYHQPLPLLTTCTLSKSLMDMASNQLAEYPRTRNVYREGKFENYFATGLTRSSSFPERIRTSTLKKTLVLLLPSH